MATDIPTGTPGQVGPTSAAPEPSSAQDVLQLIVQDHNKARYLFTEYFKATTQEVKQQLAYQIIRELCMHSCKEEEVVYPAVGKAFGSQAQQHLLDEHMQLKVLLTDLDGKDMYKQESECDALIQKIQATFEHHGKEEEDSEIPKLLKAPGVDGLELGREFEKAAAHAVTRPHTMAPDKPPMNLVANRMTAPADALADQVRFSGHVPEVPVPPTTTAI